jgi:hypothetical protein
VRQGLALLLNREVRRRGRCALSGAGNRDGRAGQHASGDLFSEQMGPIFQNCVCRFSLLMAVALLIIKDFHEWEPLGFCFIAYTFAVIESPREPHFPNRNQRYVFDFTRLPF